MHISYSHLLFTPAVHTCCSHLLFTPPVHICYSHLLFTGQARRADRVCVSIHTGLTPPIHTSSHLNLLFTPAVHTSCSHMLSQKVHIQRAQEHTRTCSNLLFKLFTPAVHRASALSVSSTTFCTSSYTKSTRAHTHMFTPSIHTLYSHLLFTPAVHRANAQSVSSTSFCTSSTGSSTSAQTRNPTRSAPLSGR